METTSLDDHPADDQLEAARRTLLSRGADTLPRPPWQHPAAPPEDAVLMRFALWRANQNVGSASQEELRAGLRLIDAARSELDTLEAALLLTARSEGMTWAEIAGALGLRSAQAAQQRYQRVSGRPRSGAAAEQERP